MTSKEKLVLALKEAKAPQQLIDSAEAGMYSDTESQIAFPIVTLVRQLRGVGLHSIADRAVAGEFDATDEEWRQWIKGDGFDSYLGGFAKEQ